MQKTVLALTFALASCAPATAQLQVTTPGNPACTEGTTLTPVVGIAVESDFSGLDGYTHADAIRSALKDAGFRTTDANRYDLLDVASIDLSGTIENWKNIDGDESRTRIGKVDVDVVDLSTKNVLFTFRQDSARLLFQAPTFAQVTSQLVGELSRRFCQMK